MKPIINKYFANEPVLDKEEAVLEPLSENGIREYLISLGIDDISHLLIFPSITSTNDFLLEYQCDSKEVVVCVAEQQTQGRGRYGHQWVSPLAVNLYLSMSWPLQSWNEKYETLSLWLLLAIANLLEKQGCSEIQLKWPNDVCVKGKKLAGVLIERKVGQAKNNLIIGVGINVAMSLNNDVEIETPWIDLITVSKDWQLSRNELVARVISVFYRAISKFEKNQLGDLNSKWVRYDMLLNKKIEFLDQETKRTALVKGIDEFGKIILEIDGKLEHFHSAHIRKIKTIGNLL